MFDKGNSRVRLEGRIAAAGFASGDRFVIGLWDRGPLGAMIDVMWAQANGTKVLLAWSQAVADFVGGVYEFDEVRVVEAHAGSRDDRVEVDAGPLHAELHTGTPLKVFRLRPRFLRRSAAWVRVEDVVFRPLAGRFLIGGGRAVRLYGRSPSGVQEWYCIDSYRPVISARATLEGQDLGPLTPLDPPAHFGFSEFPSRPAVVDCAPLLEGAERFLPGPSPRQTETL